MPEPTGSTPERAFAEGMVFYFEVVSLMAKLKPSSIASSVIAAEMLAATYRLLAHDSGVPPADFLEIKVAAQRIAANVWEETAGPGVRAARVKAALLSDDGAFDANEAAAAQAAAQAALAAILSTKE